MKKTVVLILIFLPIVLLLVIALAGRVLSTYQRIDVESVAFINEDGNEFGDNDMLVIGTGETKPTKIRIYPELATDKRVSYSSSDEAVCTVDDIGAITGVSAGSAVIVVKTVDGNKTDMIGVIVRADNVTGVTLAPETLSMLIGDSYDLKVTVEPFSALNKKVTYTTSDPSVVTVSVTGKVRAVGAGTATVTATTADGGFTDTCMVTVSSDLPPIHFDFAGVAGMTYTGTGYISSQVSVNLNSGLKLIDEIEGNVKFRVIQGDGAAVDENGILTFTHSGVIVVEAFVGDENDPTYRTEVRIALLG